MKKLILLLLIITMTSLVSATNVEIILDSSFSMSFDLNKIPKIDTVKNIASEFINSLPDETNIAIRTIEGPCESNLKMTMQKKDDEKAKTIINSLEPQGNTALVKSIVQAANDFKNNSETNYLIVLSDGAETCGGSIEEAIALLSGKNIIVNTIGFSIDEKGEYQLQKIARETGGNYYDAKDAAELELIFEKLKDIIIGVAPGSSMETAPLIVPGFYGFERTEPLPETYYKFHAKPGDLINIRAEIKERSSRKTIYLYLLNENGEELRREHASFDALFPQAIMKYPIMREQDFYIYIPSEYVLDMLLELKIESIGDTDTNIDAPNKFEDAILVQPILYGKNYLYSASYSSKDEIDFFKIKVQPGVPLNIKATPSETGQLRITIYDRDRVKLKEKTTANDGAIVRLTQNFTYQGDAYIRIYHFASNSISYAIDFSADENMDCEYITCRSWQTCQEGKCVDLEYTEEKGVVGGTNNNEKGEKTNNKLTSLNESSNLLLIISGGVALLLIIIIILIIVLVNKKKPTQTTTQADMHSPPTQQQTTQSINQPQTGPPKYQSNPETKKEPEEL
ncbi:MAG: VWA domain-containing protein [Nanoarchaeota archaeon]|nr:VWA domain-containing protein [Nanoarchaeota archaeon]